jgi:hypothetical protein
MYRNDWSTMLEKAGMWYCVQVRNAAGGIHDKVRCDDYRMALDYWRAFNAIARAAK